MNPLLLIAPMIWAGARWLKKDAARADRDPRSQERSDWLEFREWDRKQPPPPLPRRKHD